MHLSQANKAAHPHVAYTASPCTPIVSRASVHRAFPSLSTDIAASLCLFRLYKSLRQRAFVAALPVRLHHDLCPALSTDIRNHLLGRNP